MNQTMLREFANPPSAYRGKPFWAWNGKLEPEELRRQIRLMKRMGLGGFFMHSRVGLDTAYLSEDWFKCVGACVDEARRQKMEAWLYDEDRWPSGAAGGLVTKNPRYRMRSLKMDKLDRVERNLWSAGTLAIFSAKISGTTARNVAMLKPREKISLPKGYSLLRFRVEIDKPSEWYNDQTYLDTMNPEAVREFIKVTHEAYLKHNGRDFGGIVPGIFTDEPNYGHVHGWNGGTITLPWTGAIPAGFRKCYGYDLIALLPALVYDVNGPRTPQVRYHYMDCITRLFVSAFSKQIGQWCGRHNLQYTGHMLSEETLKSQSNAVGSCMRHYEYMQAPGMDLLTEGSREFGTAKQVSSVAHQFGAKWRLTETYGCTGWDFTLEGHKALGDWQAALGINLRCQHLAWYTMLAEAKRDYPAAIFYQSPWWDIYPLVEDYFGRIGAVMTRGREVRDILVVHPVESAWLHIRSEWHKSPAVNSLNRMFVDLQSTLLAANLDFDYGDEDIMSRHARVKKSQDGVSLVIGKAEYRTVVVPPMQTIRTSTLELLGRFIDAGGVVVQAGKPAKLVDAVVSKAAGKIARRCLRAPAKGQALADKVAKKARRISIVDKKGSEIVPALHLLTCDKDNYYLFVCNTSEDYRKVNPKWVVGHPHTRDRKLDFPAVTIKGFADCAGTPIELDPKDGAIYATNAKRKGRSWHIATSLPRLASRLFIIPRNAGKTPKLASRPSLKTVRSTRLNPNRWDLTLSEHNVLVLDRPAYTIGAGKEQRPLEILKVDDKVRDSLGVRHRGGAMVQPWARSKSEAGKSARVKLRYTFEAVVRPSGELLLALEQAGRYSVSVNGTAVDTDVVNGWWVDRSLQTLRIAPSLIRIGTNEVVLECDYSNAHPGFEIAYLLGTFGVSVKGTVTTLTRPPNSLRLGDWTRQGLPFYSGHAAYSTAASPKFRRGQRVFLDVSQFKGVGVRVLVNGKVAGVAGWPPYEVDITDSLTGGRDTVSVEVLGHRRNSHGPLHNKILHPGWTGPWDFKRMENWTDSPFIVPCGLMGPPKLVVKR